MEDRLAELLGMPSTCPHGNPIPGMAVTARVEVFPLNQAREGTTVVVERITEEAEADKNLLEYLWRNEVRPGRRLQITEVAPWAGTITASGDGRTIALGLPAAAKIWVYLEVADRAPAAARSPTGRVFASSIILATRSRSSPGGTTATNFSHEAMAPCASFLDSRRI